MDTGAKIRDIQGEGKVEIMWSDDRKIVTISKEGDITVYKMCWKFILVISYSKSNWNSKIIISIDKRIIHMSICQ